MMRCPCCGQWHPQGTTYCDIDHVQLSELSFTGVVTQEESTSSIQLPSSTPIPSTLREIVTCKKCGRHQYPGEECSCGEVIPSDQSESDRTIKLLLPDGKSITIPCGQEILVGRHSEIPEIKEFLSLGQFDDRVSRMHCRIEVDPSGTQLTVRDLKSINGTWVGESPPVKLRSDEPHTAKLPVRIRLGSDLPVFLSFG